MHHESASLLTMMAVGLICCSSIIARSDEVLKFRIVMHATSIQSQEVGDVDGHTVSVGRYSGLASFPDGSVGTASFTFTTDYTKGAGTFFSYFTMTLKDGSTLWWKGTGPAQPDGTSTIYPEFPVSVLRGTGRFEGAKGDGRQKGARVTPLSAGAELYADAEISLKK
jgi:hypothetical protein